MKASNINPRRRRTVYYNITVHCLVEVIKFQDITSVIRGLLRAMTPRQPRPAVMIPIPTQLTLST